MIRIGKEKVPYFASEITYSDYIDFLKADKTNVDILIGKQPDWKRLDQTNAETVKRNIIDNACNYDPINNDSFIHKDQLYIYRDIHDISLLEGILAMNYARMYGKSDSLDYVYVLRLYLIATLSVRIKDGKPENIPTNLGVTFSFMESKVKELRDISLKNAMDFQYVFNDFENKLSEPFYEKAFKPIYPNPRRNDVEPSLKAWSDFYGSWSIYETLKRERMIDSLAVPFFHACFLYGLISNK